MDCTATIFCINLVANPANLVTKSKVCMHQNRQMSNCVLLTACNQDRHPTAVVSLSGTCLQMLNPYQYMTCAQTCHDGQCPNMQQLRTAMYTRPLTGLLQHERHTCH